MDLLFSTTNKLYLSIFLICALSFTTIFLPAHISEFLVLEDGPFESAGALLFLASSILFFILYLKENKFADQKDRIYFNSIRKRTWFLLLALLFFLLMGEEISWGQRIFGFEGLPFNIQFEFNLHNLWFWNTHDSHPGSDNEVVKTGIAAYFTSKKIFVYVFLLFLFILPLGVRYIPLIKKLVIKYYIPVPALELGVLFILNILLFKLFKPMRYAYDGAGRGLSEIEEFNFAFILFMVPLVWLYNKKGNFNLDYLQK